MGFSGNLVGVLWFGVFEGFFVGVLPVGKVDYVIVFQLVTKTGFGMKVGCGVLGVFWG